MTSKAPRYTLAQARRAPQWRRLIDTVHAAQAAAGYEGRQFGAAEMEHFGATLVGMPWEMPYSRRAFWAERQSNDHSDGTTTVHYVVKAWDADEAPKVETIWTTPYEEWMIDPTPEQDEAAALDALGRAAFQVGGTL
jgi:hypothetical protein